MKSYCCKDPRLWTLKSQEPKNSSRGKWRNSEKAETKKTANGKGNFTGGQWSCPGAFRLRISGMKNIIKGMPEDSLTMTARKYIRPHTELSILLHALFGVLSLVKDNGTRSSIRHNLCFSLLIRLCLISAQHKAEVTADGCTKAEMREISCCSGKNTVRKWRFERPPGMEINNLFPDISGWKRSKGIPEQI